MKYIEAIALLHIKNKKLLMAKPKSKDAYMLPGGKREPGENDVQTLIREINEELCAMVLPETIQYYATFEAQAYGQPDGIIVRLICYKASIKNEPKAHAEIEDCRYFSYNEFIEQSKIAPGSLAVFDSLKNAKLIR